MYLPAMAENDLWLMASQLFEAKLVSAILIALLRDAEALGYTPYRYGIGCRIYKPRKIFGGLSSLGRHYPLRKVDLRLNYAPPSSHQNSYLIPA